MESYFVRHRKRLEEEVHQETKECEAESGREVLRKSENTRDTHLFPVPGGPVNKNPFGVSSSSNPS